MINKKKVTNIKPISYKFKLICAGVILSIITSGGYLEYQNYEKNRDKTENKIGYYDINSLANIKVHDNNFVILNAGDHAITGVNFFDKKVKKCNDKNISVGIIINPTKNNEDKIYDDVELVKGIIEKYKIDLPVYLNINEIIEDKSLNVEIKTKLIRNFLDKCSANKIYVGVYGTDTNLCRMKKNCNITEYDAFLKMDDEIIKYDGTYYICEDIHGKIESKEDLSKVITKNKLNIKENLVPDKKHIVSANEQLIDIAMQYGMSEKDLLEFNDIKEKDITEGTNIRIPSLISNDKCNYEYKQLEIPIKGCDMSYAQSNKNWELLDKNFDFIILKLNQGLNLDSKFLENVRQCSIKNISYGIYCYNNYNGKDYFDKEEFRKIQEQQADFVLENLKNKDLEYPIFLDLEVPSGKNFRLENSKEDINIILDVWKEKIKNADYNFGIYTNRDNLEHITSSVDYKLEDEMYLWISGGKQFTGETEDIEFNDIVPCNNPYIYNNKDYKVHMTQPTDSAINAGASNYKGHLDIDYSYIDFSIKNINTDLEIKTFKRINLDLLKLLCSQGIIIPSCGLLIKRKNKKKVKK